MSKHAKQTALFTLANASVSAGDHPVFENISLSINDGEKVAIVGQSGAGKSTLLNTLYTQQANDIAFCPQADLLVNILSVYHNIYMGQLEQHSFIYNAWNLLRPIARHRTAIKKVAAQLGIAEKLHHSVDRLSGGQQQRVAIGRALYRKRAIFFGDEPVSSLDPVQSHKLLTFLLQEHPTAVVSLHDVDLALDLFDRIIGLKHGQLIFDLPAASVSPENMQALYEQ